MLLGIVITWLVVNALIVAFLLFHPLRHFSGGGKTSPTPSARAGDKPPQRSMV